MATPATNPPVVSGLVFVVMWAKLSMCRSIAHLSDACQGPQASLRAGHAGLPMRLSSSAAKRRVVSRRGAKIDELLAGATDTPA